MKKNYIAPATTTYSVVEQKVIAVSFNAGTAPTVNDTELDVKDENWNIWTED